MINREVSWKVRGKKHTQQEQRKKTRPEVLFHRKVITQHQILRLVCPLWKPETFLPLRCNFRIITLFLVRCQSRSFLAMCLICLLLWRGSQQGCCASGSGLSKLHNLNLAVHSTNNTSYTMQRIQFLLLFIKTTATMKLRIMGCDLKTIDFHDIHNKHNCILFRLTDSSRSGKSV